MARYDDPRILRAIAHPTRNQVLHELSAAGSLRAADVAQRLDIPANQASFHLRQLAKYGLVEEDPDAARDKRDRVWRLVDADGITFRAADVLAQPGGPAAYQVFQRSAVARGYALVDRVHARDADVAEEFRLHRSVAEWTVRLDRDEVEALAAELEAVVERYRTSGQRPNQQSVGFDAEDDGRSTYSIYQLIQPYVALPSPHLPAPARSDEADSTDAD